MPWKIKYASPVPEGIPFAKCGRVRKRKECDGFYGLTRWRNLRDRFIRLNPLCVRCAAKGITEAATVVHHIKERLEYPELAYTVSNLEALCNSCHTTGHKSKR